MWRCEDVDLQMWRCEDVDQQIWRCEDVDQQVWGCEDVDQQMWRCEDVDQQMWGCEDVYNGCFFTKNPSQALSGKMSFTQELTCRWSTSTWTPTRLLPARSFAQKLLHRSCYTGVQLTSRGSNCMWTPAKSDFSSSSISLWRQRQPGGGLRNVTLCGVSDIQTCGEMRVLFVLGQPSAEIVRSCRMGKHVAWWNAKLLCPQQPSAEIVRLECPNMWWNVNFFWARATLCRDRAGRRARRSPFARNEGQPSKTCVKSWFWKFRCKRGMKVKRQ